jgi:putative endonuclease
VGIKDRKYGLFTLIPTFMHKRAKGNIGEDVACKYLENKGFVIVVRNYLRKWGELDIIAQKDKIIHFFEVKSVTVDFDQNSDSHKPEDNVHRLKLKRIRRMIETYLDEKHMLQNAEFQFHVITVFINEKTRLARVKMIKNLVI